MPCYRCCVASYFPVEELAALNCIHVTAESHGAESIAALRGAPTQDADTPATLELLQADMEAFELSARHRCRGSTALSMLPEGERRPLAGATAFPAQGRSGSGQNATDQLLATIFDITKSGQFESVIFFRRFGDDLTH
jgi:hypothetical protein